MGTGLCVVWLRTVGVGDRYFLDFGARPVPSLILAAFLGYCPLTSGVHARSLCLILSLSLVYVRLGVMCAWVDAHRWPM
jgi:meiotically up-regulated gene 157 (Mug157) protein